MLHLWLVKTTKKKKKMSDTAGNFLGSKSVCDEALEVHS